MHKMKIPQILTLIRKKRIKEMDEVIKKDLE